MSGKCDSVDAGVTGHGCMGLHACMLYPHHNLMRMWKQQQLYIAWCALCGAALAAATWLVQHIHSHPVYGACTSCFFSLSLLLYGMLFWVG